MAKKKARKRKIVKIKSKVKKAAARKKKVVSKKAQAITLEKIGEVTHYFPKVKAAAVLILKDGLKLGDKIQIKGHTTDFKEKVGSMQLDHVPIDLARKGQEIGLLVKSRVRTGDNVYKV
ncbi:MAG: translation elongation factor-like protein [Candidatus Omnitrophica bacterium]|nr:translation elongation factor-like protein [Candidatus Omnitrophota bacterium]